MSDGFIIDIESKNVLSTFSSGEFRFYCPYNQCVLTHDDKVIALAFDHKGNLNLVQVNSDGSQFRELAGFGHHINT